MRDKQHKQQTLGRAADVLEAGSETVAEVIEMPETADAEAESGGGVGTDVGTSARKAGDRGER